MKFKAEISLLIAAIAVFFASTFVYYSSGVALGISLVGFGSVLMVAASVSYSKRNKKTRLLEA